MVATVGLLASPSIETTMYQHTETGHAVGLLASPSIETIMHGPSA